MFEQQHQQTRNKWDDGTHHSLSNACEYASCEAIAVVEPLISFFAFSCLRVDQIISEIAPLKERNGATVREGRPLVTLIATKGTHISSDNKMQQYPVGFPPLNEKTPTHPLRLRLYLERVL